MSNVTTLLPNLTTLTMNVTLRTEEEILMRDVYFAVFGVSLCIISSIGMSTNLVNVYALTQTVRTYRKPMYHFLLAMAAMDTMVMLVLLCRSASFYLVKPILVNPEDFEQGGVLKVSQATYYFYHLWYTCVDILMTISNWCTVAMGLFRVVAVFWPLRAASLCTAKRAQLTIVLIILFGVLINLPLYLEFSYTEEGLITTGADVGQFGVISLIFTVPVPIFTCLVINLALIAKIKLNRVQIERMCETRASVRNRRLQSGVLSVASGSSITTSSSAERTLISVSLFYVIMSAPNVIYYLLLYTHTLEELSKFSQNMFYIAANMSIYISHAGNFFFYVLLNKAFRTLLWKNAFCLKVVSNNSTTVTRLTPGTPTSASFRRYSRHSTPISGSRRNSRNSTPVSTRKPTNYTKQPLRRLTPQLDRRPLYGMEEITEKPGEIIQLDQLNGHSEPHEKTERTKEMTLTERDRLLNNNKNPVIETTVDL